MVMARAEKPEADVLVVSCPTTAFPKEFSIIKRWVLDVGAGETSKARILYLAPPSKTAL